MSLKKDGDFYEKIKHFIKLSHISGKSPINLLNKQNMEKYMPEYFIKVAAQYYKHYTLLILITLLTACSDPGGVDGNSLEEDNSAPSSNTINGKITANAISGATIQLYFIENGNVANTPAFTATSDSNGDFLISSGTHTGPVLLEATGGTYIDEATANPVSNSTRLRVMSPDINGIINITPLTELATRLANASVGNTLSLETIVIQNNNVSVYFSGESNNKINIVKTSPVIPTSAFPQTALTDEKNYGFLLAMLSQFDTDINSTLTTIEAEIGQNGLSTQIIQNLTTAFNIFLSGSFNQTGISTSPLTDIISNKGNTAPSFNDMNFNITLNSSFSQQLVAVDSDSQTSLSYSISGNTLANFNLDSTGSFNFTPLALGIHTVDILVDDGAGALNSQQIATLAFTVTSNNAAPTTQSLTITPFFNTEISGQLIASDSDGDMLTYALESSPSKGIITSFNTQTGSFTYHPSICTGSRVAPGNNQCTDNGIGTPVITAGVGSATFTFSVTDGTDTSQIETVTINIIGDKTLGQTLYMGDNQNNISCGNASCHGPFANATTQYSMYKRGSLFPVAAIHPLTSSPTHANILSVFTSPQIENIESIDDLILDDGSVLASINSGSVFGHVEIANGSIHMISNYLDSNNLSHIAAYLCSVNTTGTPAYWNSQVAGTGNENYYDVTFSCSLNEQ
jgi:hypothetical protein